MLQYDVALFDLDGTLTDSAPGILNSVRFALSQYGIVEEDMGKLRQFIGPPLVESFMEYYGFAQEKAMEAVAYYREYFKEKGMFENALYPGVLHLLGSIADKGMTIILATSKPVVFAEKILEHFKIDGFFSAVIGSNLDGSMSAKTEIIGLILDTLVKAPKQRVVMIGDRKHDIIGARNNAIDSIGVVYGYGSPAELQKAGATYIAASVEQLGALLLEGNPAVPTDC